MPKWISLTGLHAACLLLIALHVGCAPVGRSAFDAEPYTQAIDAQELADHVHLLADPALEGRKPNSPGSRTARRYIAARFAACRLEPWHRTDSYEQPFGLGTNIVGVLPGRDPALRDQFVIVMAHYDHVGVVNGQIHPGAGDNASGVAALLEIAEQLCHEPDRPARSVVFACFDSEESNYLGAFTFTGRDDFDPRRIVAVMNIDMLGRATFDVMPDTLLTIGVGDVPGLAAHLRQAAEEQQLRLLPIGADLAGPVSDHFAFEQFDLPCVMFSCGLFGDYHKPTDTADRLDYVSMQKSARVIAQAIRYVADGEAPATAPAGDDAARRELGAISTGLETVLARADQLNLRRADLATLRRMRSQIDALLSKPRIGPQDRRRLRWDLVQNGAPIALRYARPDREHMTAAQVAGLVQFHEFLATHRRLASRTTQRVVSYYVDNRFNFLRLLIPATYGGVEIAPSEIAFVAGDDRQHRLAFVYPEFTVTASIRGRDTQLAYRAVDFAGTRDDAIDFALLTWLDGQVPDEVIREVLVTVTGNDAGAEPADWLAWRLDRLGLPDERAWRRSLLHSRSPALLKRALQWAAANRISVPGEVVGEIIENEALGPDVRAEAIRALAYGVDRDALLSLAAAVTDPSPLPTQPEAFAFDRSYPLYEHPFLRYQRATQRRPRPQPAHVTVGALARAKLHELTGQDFGADPIAWITWIERQM